MKPCTICGRPAVEELPCYNCHGSGRIPDPECQMVPPDHWMVDPECDGTGKLGYCEKCLAIKKSEMWRAAGKRNVGHYSSGHRSYVRTHRASPEQDQQGREAQAHGSPDLVAQPLHPWSLRFGGAHPRDILPAQNGYLPGLRTGQRPAWLRTQGWPTREGSLGTLSITITRFAHPRLDRGMENTPRHARATPRQSPPLGSYLVLGSRRERPMGGYAVLGMLLRGDTGVRGKPSGPRPGAPEGQGRTQLGAECHGPFPSRNGLGLTCPSRTAQIGQRAEEVNDLWTPSM